MIRSASAEHNYRSSWIPSIAAPLKALPGAEALVPAAETTMRSEIVSASERRVSVPIPGWLRCPLAARPPVGLDLGERMRFVIELARRNARESTGGPFAAAVFERETGLLVSAGVNLVTYANCSVLHAEIVALMLAQSSLGTYDLGADGLPDHQLVTSTEPCAMCFGAIHWSGVRELACGARTEDALSIGFDEGEKPADWVAALERRGVKVVRNVVREEAAAVLAEYARAGGIVYNPRPPR